MTAQLTQKYALDETTPGFLNHTLPKINAATEKVSNKALKDRVEYQKGYLPPVAAALISALWGDFKAQRLRKDPQLIIGNQTINNDDTPESRKAIDAALYSQAEAILDSHSAQMGLTGEPTYLGKKVAEILFANADSNSVEDPQFKKFAKGIRTGPAIVVNPATGEKERMTLGALYSQESVDSEMKYGAYAFQQQQREQQQQIETAQDLALDGRPASPGRPELPSLLRTPFNDPAAQQALVEEHYKAWQLEHPGGSKTKFLEALNKVRGIVKDIPGYDYPANGVADLFNDMRGRYGDDWDPKQAAREYNEFRQTQINPKDLGAADREFDNLRRQKNSENGTLFRGTVNRIVQDEVTAALNREYGTGNEASISGMGMVALKAASANRAAARANLNKALYPYVNAAINAAAAKEKASLSEAQTMQIAQDAVRQYGTLSETSKAAYRTLFPGGRVSGAPSVPGTMATPATPGATGKPAQAAPATYGVQQLDNFPKRQQRLLNWQNETILNREGIQTELMRLQAGQGFSPQLKRAAMDGRARTPAEFLEGQMKRYGMSITPRAMKHLQEISSAETTPMRYVSTLTNAVYPSVARASRWALDAITGTQPSIAAEMPAGGAPARPQRLIAFNPYRRPAASYGGGSGMGGAGMPDHGGLAALISSGEGGFNSVNYGTTGSGREINLTSMLIGQVERMQARGQVSAVGFAQWMPGNLTRARQAAGLPANAPMSPANQQKMFWAYVLNSNKQPALRDYLTGQSGNLNAAHRALSGEWAAIQGPNGRGTYDGDSAGNMASISAAKVRQALIRARQSITGRN